MLQLSERLEFVNQTKELFQSIDILQGLAVPENEPLSLNSDAWDTASGLFASSISCQIPNFAFPAFQHGHSHGDFMETIGHEDFMETRCSSDNITGCSNFQSQQSLIESGSFFELPASEGPYNSKLSNSDVQESSILNSLCKSELFVDMAKTSQQFSECRMSNRNFVKDQFQMPSSLCTFDELFPKLDFAKALSKHDKNDDLFQWFSPMTEESNEMVTAELINDISRTSEVVSLSSNPKGHHSPIKVISDKQPSTSVQSSVTALNSAEGEKYSDIFGIDKQFDCSGVDIGSRSSGYWEDTVVPLEIGGHLDISASSSNCISEQYVDSKFRTSNTLFSKLGLHQRLEEIGRGSCSVARSDLNDQLYSTAKRRKIETPLLTSNEVSCLSRFDGSVNSFQPVYHLNSSSNFEFKDKVINKLEAGPFISDNCSIIAGNTVSSPKKLEQPAKTIKKKAKPGTKPRPKDRQQIHDRLLELRELVPNGEKVQRSQFDSKINENYKICIVHLLSDKMTPFLCFKYERNRKICLPLCLIKRFLSAASYMKGKQNLETINIPSSYGVIPYAAVKCSYCTILPYTVI